MALFAALTLFVHATFGFTHPSLRQKVADLLRVELAAYTAGQMTYDLRRLRLKGLIWCISGTHRYLLTPYGRKVVVVHFRVFPKIRGS